jgi:uncharacterized protein with GYD domain
LNSKLDNGNINGDIKQEASLCRYGKLAIRLSAKGTTQTLTLAAITLDALISALKKKETPW